MLGFKLHKQLDQDMAPALPKGSTVLVCRWLRYGPIAQGDRILVAHRHLGEVVKTVALVDKYGFIWCKSEQPDGMTVEQFGPLRKAQVKGKVVYGFLCSPKHPANIPQGIG